VLDVIFRKRAECEGPPFQYTRGWQRRPRLAVA
jgi:hypothetical protein